MAKVWRYTVIGESPSGEERWACNLHYQTDVPTIGTEPGADTVLTQIDQHFSTSGTGLQLWRNTIDPASKLVETRLYEEVNPASDDIPTGHVNVYNLVGLGNAISGDILPTAMCVYLTLFTGKLGRSFRGGVHTPPVRRPADLDGGGTWDNASNHWTQVVALGTAIVDQLEDVFQTTGDINPVIYSRTRRARGEDQFANKLTTFRANADVRWLRRREPTHG